MTELTDVDEIERLSHQIFGMIRGKDVRRLAEILADDFVYQAPGAADVGRDAFLDGIQSIPGTIESIMGEHLRVRVVSGAGVVTGVQRSIVVTEAGERVSSAIAFVDIFERREGEWRLVLAHGTEFDRLI